MQEVEQRRERLPRVGVRVLRNFIRPLTRATRDLSHEGRGKDNPTNKKGGS
jgi:hypothetical protein